MSQREIRIGQKVLLVKYPKTAIKCELGQEIMHRILNYSLMSIVEKCAAYSDQRSSSKSDTHGWVTREILADF